MSAIKELWQLLDAWCEKYLSVYHPEQGGW